MRITLCFSTTRHWLSALIRWLSGAKASHVSLGLYWEGVPFQLQADVGGLLPEPRQRWLQHNILVAEYEIIPDVIEGVRHALSEMQTRYDYVGLLGLGIVMVGRRLKKRWRNPWASSEAMVCSELVFEIDRGEKIPAWAGLDPEATSPGDLLKICEKSPSFRKLS